MKAVEAGPDTFYAWGDACSGWRLLELEHLQVRQETMPPGTTEAPHVHRSAHQFFYVLAGTMTLSGPEGPIRLGPRQGIHVPAGMAHRVRNAGACDLVFLLVSGPSTAGDRTPVDPSSWGDHS